MYLIVTKHKTEQVERIRSDSTFYGWVIDNNVGVFKHEDNTFEQLKIVSKYREHSASWAYAGYWTPVIANPESAAAFKGC